MSILGTMFLLGLLATADSTIEQQVDCMAKNIYYEAPDEPYEGKLAVATVTMNRVANSYYPNTVCEVVYQPWQFSWTMVKGLRPIRKLHVFDEALRIARQVIYDNKRLTSIRNSMFYHNQTVTPKWSFDMFPIQRIGGHTFYVPRRP